MQKCVLLQWCWPMTSNCASQVVSLLEVESNFGFWPPEREIGSLIWQGARPAENLLQLTYRPRPIIAECEEIILPSKFHLREQSRPPWRLELEGHLWPLLPEDYGLFLGQRFAAFCDSPSQDRGQRSPRNQEQHPPAKTLLQRWGCFCI